VATEPVSETPNTAASSSAIENELTTYRAVSVLAITGFVAGLFSALSFASLFFLAASVLAVVFGAVALKRIRTYPDLLTGAGFANLGIAMGLIFGLSATTYKVSQQLVLNRQAAAFGKVFAEAANSGSLAEVLYYCIPPSGQAEETPEGVLLQMRQMMEQRQDSDPRLPVAERLIARMNSSDEEHIDLDRVLEAGFDGTKPEAYVRLVVHGPNDGRYDETEAVLLQISADIHNGRRGWWVEDLTYPFVDEDVPEVVAPAHSHGGGAATHAAH